MSAPSWLLRISLYRWARYRLQDVIDAVRRSRRRTAKLADAYLKANASAKLHIGCGDNPLPGWLNTEFDDRPPEGAIFMDASRAFPLPGSRFDLVFSEHVIEHLPLSGARSMLEECFRVLKPGGRIRLCTPPLEFLAEMVLRPTPDHLRYASYHYEMFSEEGSLKSPAGVLNDFHRLWGHQFVYDAPSFQQLLSDAGFVEIEQVALNESTTSELRDLENDRRMPDGMLALVTMCFEARKPAL